MRCSVRAGHAKADIERVREQRRQSYWRNRDKILAKNRRGPRKLVPLALEPGQLRPRPGTTEYKVAWAKANRAKRKAAQDAYYQRNKEKVSAKNRAYRENNQEKRRACVKSWADRNQNKVRAIRNRAMKKWYRENHEVAKERYIEQSHKRRALKAGNGGSGVPLSAWKGILSIYGNRCIYCGDSKRLTRDHVIPITRGGKDEPENIVPACHQCNSRKKNKLFSEWGGSDKPICL